MNYLKTALKFIKRNKFFAGINIIGLSIALAASFVMLLYIVNEFSFDSMHKNRDDVYRIVKLYPEFNEKGSGTSFRAAEDLKVYFPQIEKATNGRIMRRFAVKINGSWVRQRAMETSAELFDIFTIPIISQNTATENLLKSPNDIILSRKLAKLAFNDENPLGKQLEVSFEGSEKQFNVVAVTEDLPENSTIKAACFIQNSWTLKGLDEILKPFASSYRIPFWTTWIKTSKGSNIDDLSNNLSSFLLTHNVDTSLFQYGLQNLKDYHLHSENIDNSGAVGSLNRLKVMIVIMLLILIVATFNYISLSTAISTGRAKEIGIRKTTGASISVIRTQLLSESVFISLIALPIAIFMMYAAMPYVNELFKIKLTYIGSNKIIYALFFVSLTIIIGLLSGFYSVYYLSKLNPVEILSKKLFVGQKKNILRSSLIVFQIIVFFVFVSSAFIVNLQYKFAMNKDLGYRTSNVLFLNLPDDEEMKYSLLLEQVGKIPNVISAGCSMDALPMIGGSSSTYNHFVDKDKEVELEALDVNYNYLQTLGIKLKEGRYFSKEFSGDLNNSIILNQKAVKALGITDPIGKQLDSMTIIGVTEDFILHSIHKPVPPMTIELTEDFIMQMAIHYEEGQLNNLLPILEKEWAKIYKDIPMQYSTSADINKDIYANEQDFLTIITAGALFTIFLAVLGLLGISLYIGKSRTKEIGIRRVVGSSRGNIILMLLKSSVYQVVAASILAIPISYFIMQEWLNNYAFSVKINFWYFVITTFISLVVVIFTVIGQAYRAANRNPVEALRYE